MDDSCSGEGNNFDKKIIFQLGDSRLYYLGVNYYFSERKNLIPLRFKLCFKYYFVLSFLSQTGVENGFIELLLILLN